MDIESLILNWDESIGNYLYIYIHVHTDTYIEMNTWQDWEPKKSVFD